jgi:hypothetical protein
MKIIGNFANIISPTPPKSIMAYLMVIIVLSNLASEASRTINCEFLVKILSDIPNIITPTPGKRALGFLKVVRSLADSASEVSSTPKLPFQNR